MKNYRTHFISKAIFLIITTFLILVGCSLNNPFLQTEDPIPPTPEPIHVESVSLQGKKTIERYIGGKYECKYTVLPVDAENKTVFFTCSNSKIATVDEKGLVTAIAVGETIITVTTEDGKKTDIITFIVYEKPVEYVDVESITVTPESLELTAGDEFLLTAVVLPDNATDRSEITWTSSDESIAKVNQDGLVTAIAEGEVTITATTVNNEIFDTVKVKVNRKLAPEIIVTSPNGGEEYTFKTSTTITWTTKDIESDKVKVELIDTLTGNEYLIADEVEGNCYWYVDQSAEYKEGENYKIRITTIPNADESADAVFVDESDEVFKLSKIVPTLELTRPTEDTNNGYFCLSNTINANIEWVSTDMESDNVSLYLVKKDGTPVEVIAENISNTGSYIWKLPEDKNEWADGSEYKIKIYRYDVKRGELDEEVFSESSMEFTLKEVKNPFLKFLAPNEKKLYIGTRNDITWEGVGFAGDVKIELVPEDTSVRNYVIAESAPNNSCFEWDIKEDVMEGGDFDLSTKYKIRITTLNTNIRYLSGDRKRQLVDRMEDVDGNPIKDIDGNEIVLENPGTLVAESAIYLEAILAPNVYFILDDSGSMAWTKPTRTEILKKRMDNAAVALARNFNIGIAAMNSTRVGLEMKKGWSAADIRASYTSLGASGITPTSVSLKKIREGELFRLKDDIYDEYRRKAVVVITDGGPQNSDDGSSGFQKSLDAAVLESAQLAALGIPVFYMGIDADATLAKKLQEMAVAGGSDNSTDPTKNWYPIDEDSQFEAALHEIMYGELEVAGSMVEYEIDCGTPDSGNSIYFYGDYLLLGNTKSPSSASGLLKATYKNGKYSIKIRKQDNANFSWGIVEADSKGNIMKIEKAPLHSSNETSPTFNGWDENTIIIKVKQSFGYNYIYAWDIEAKTPILSEWPGVAMTLSGSDYVYSILGRTSCGVLITNNSGNKLCVSDMIASSPGTWRVTSNGIKKEN